MTNVNSREHAARHIEIIAGGVALLVFFDRAAAQSIIGEGDDSVTRIADDGTGDVVRVMVTSDSGGPGLLTILESGSGNYANRRSSFSF